MARRRFEPPIEPAPVAIPSIATTIRGDLHLTLPDDLAERIATAIVARLHPPPIEDGAERSSPDWWWTPITQKEAAAFLGTSPSTLSALSRRQDLPVLSMLGPRSPRYYRAQLVAWQLGLPIPLPPWSASTPMDWLWCPLSPDAAQFLRCRVEDLEILDLIYPAGRFPASATTSARNSWRGSSDNRSHGRRAGMTEPAGS